MVIFTWKCPWPDNCDNGPRRWHTQTMDYNPGDSGTILTALAYMVNEGVSDISVRVPHLGKIAGITAEGMIWASNPN